MGLRHGETIHNLSISGQIVASAAGGPGRDGQSCLYMYTALNDPIQIGPYISMPFDYMYMIGNVCVNDWVLIKMDKREPDFFNTETNLFGQGKIVHLPRHTRMRPGMTALYEKRKSHRIEKDLFQTTNPGEKSSLVAVKKYDILAFKKN
jgi:hypothetical protein